MAARIAATDSALDNMPLRRKVRSSPINCATGMFLEWRTQPLAVPSSAVNAHSLISILRIIRRCLARFKAGMRDQIFSIP